MKHSAKYPPPDLSRRQAATESSACRAVDSLGATVLDANASRMSAWPKTTASPVRAVANS